MVAPLIKMLRREFPAASITWIIGKAAHPAVALLERASGVEFIVIDKPRGPGDYLALRRRMAGRAFDALLCLQASWRAHFIHPCIRAHRKIGYGNDRARDMHALFVREKLPPSPRTHILDGFLQFGEALGATRSPADYEGAWGLEADPAALAWAETTLPRGRWLAVSPCASKAERDWSAASCAETLTRAWRAHKLPVVLLGGSAPREHAMADSIRARLDPGCPVTKLTGATTVPQLVAALSRCAALLAPDTGAVHIARAFDRPVVGLYAVAPSTRTGPYARLDYCVDKFPEAVALAHGATANVNDRKRRVHDPRAMNLITPSEVARQLDRALALECA
jgi:heptosyltransferase I